MVNKLIYLGIGIISGITGYKIYSELTKERGYDELKEYAKSLNVEIDGFLESKEFHNKPKNFINLVYYRLSLPKQCIKNYKEIYN